VPWVTRGRDPSERWGAEKVVRQIEVWMIEEVEGLGTELKIDAFSNSRVLQ
jgi:hypothetical protein